MFKYIGWIILFATIISGTEYILLSQPLLLHFLVLFSLITLILSSILFLYHRECLKNKDKVRHLKISKQEYALSERTTNYLINIMHHKLNTPLKILSTKSRVLIEHIVDSNMDLEIKERAEWDFVQIDRALKSIFTITNKLKSYNELSQNEVNMYKLFSISRETIDILKDDDFEMEIDYKSKLFEINTEYISSHEIIQIFINQLKFSLIQLADKITVKIFNHGENHITILYSDNGNPLSNEQISLLNTMDNVLDRYNQIKYVEIFDLILNFDIINNSFSSIRLLSSTANGNIFEIKLPTKKFIKKTQPKDQQK